MRVLALTGICLMLVGCAASFKGGPERLFSVNEETQSIKQSLSYVGGPEWYQQYVQSSGAGKRELRDQIVFARMYAIDLFYSQYEAQLTSERQNVGFFSTLASLALTSSATLVADATAKSILSATTTGLTGAREAYDKNILIERTISVLQQQMRAQRLIVRTKIVQRLTNGVEIYPLEFALIDIEDYYRAGTITGALIGAEETAGARLEHATALEAQVISARFFLTDLSPRIEAYWRANANQKRLVEDWVARHVGVNVTLFMYSDQYSEQQARIVRELSIP